MSPSYAVKKGVRYRYYVSQALLQGDKANTGSVPRVSAPEVEELIRSALRRVLKLLDDTIILDRAFVGAHVARVVVGPDRIEAEFYGPSSAAAKLDAAGELDGGADEVDPIVQSRLKTTKIGIPFTPVKNPGKGVVYAPDGEAKQLDAEASEQLLKAITRSRQWMEAISSGRTLSFEDIAAAENLNEAYVRRLAVLAFLSPKIVRAIAGGVAPASSTASALTLSLPFDWAEQEQKFEIG